MFSVGVLYSSQSFLRLVRDQAITVELFRESFRRFEVADAAAVLALVQKCQWANVSRDGALRLTDRGHVIAELVDEGHFLRAQLADLIAIESPPWAKRILLGRAEAQRSMPTNVEQCFKSCGLFEGNDDAVVEWWDFVALSIRSKKSGFNLRIGRLAERLTVTQERARTGKEPKWQAIESNVSGFDVLSVKDRDRSEVLRIEVKGSTMRLKEATFFVTRNEWETAINSMNYEFHLWLLHEQPRLFVVEVNTLETHLPINQGGGKWENTQLRYMDFGDNDVPLQAEALAACRSAIKSAVPPP